MPQNPATPITYATPLRPRIHWSEADRACTALWRSERGGAAPTRVVLADDTLTADNAYRLACAGTGMLWRGDFQNARQLLQAIVRRMDQVPKRKRGKSAQPVPITEAFNLHRQAQAQRARTLGMLLIELDANNRIDLRRAPDVHVACSEAWHSADAVADAAPHPATSVVSLRELQGVTSASEWRRVGVEIAALGEAPGNRIHPHYGVFSPVRGEYLGLVATAHLPKAPKGLTGITAFDIGTGTGVLAALLVHRGVNQVVATELESRALACARDNVARLGLQRQITVLQTDMFPPGRASLIVCNPPWLPARPGSPLERAVYDEGSHMLKGFLTGLAAHLAPGGEGWLILSDLAEWLGLRTREELLAAFALHGLRVVSRIDARPQHPKASEASDALHQARGREITSLWRLAVQKPAPAPGQSHEAAAD